MKPQSSAEVEWPKVESIISGALHAGKALKFGISLQNSRKTPVHIGPKDVLRWDRILERSYSSGILRPTCSLYLSMIEVTQGTLKANCERTHAENLDLDQDDIFTKLLER